MKSTPFVAALLLGSALAGWSTSAMAADAADELDTDANAIIVTTQKLQQRAVDVPITLSVVTGERMKTLGITDLGQLSAYVPGLNIQVQSANNPGFVIRGITSDSGSAQQSPRVTVYYNGVDISRSRGAYQGIYDMDRIEVVKGPQATLFGTASEIGAISLVSAKPTAGTSAEMTAGYGNYNAVKLEGHVNTGNDVLAGRLAWQWIKRDGYVKNLAPNQDDLYAQDQLGLRGSLRYTPSSNVTVDFVGTYDRERNSGTPFLSKNLGSTAVDGVYGAAYLGGSPRSAKELGLAKLGLHRDVLDANLTLNWDMGDGWSFTTVNGYRHFNALEVFDADGSAASYLEFAEHANGWEASHEGRFAYKSQTLRASVGWNYFIDDSYQKVPFSMEEGTFYACSTAATPAACVAPDNTVPASFATSVLTGGAITSLPYTGWYKNEGRNQTYSVFGDMTWIPTPALELTGGVRVLYEKRRSGYIADIPNSVLYGLLGRKAGLIPGLYDTDGETYHATRSYWAALPRFNALYHITPNINVYATISEGRRSPVVSLSAQTSGNVTVPALSIVPAEKVWNYEGGIKGNVGPISGSLGVYYDKYSGFQVSVYDQGTGKTTTTSAGSAGNLGVEGELDAQLASWLHGFANFGYISGGVDNKASNGVFAGNQFRLQPKWQWAAGIMIDKPINERTSLFLTPSVTYRSKIYFELPNKAAISQDAVTLVNIRGGLKLAHDRFEITGWAKNLTNKRYLLDAGNTGGSFGYPTFIPAEPRTYGIEITARY